METIKIDIMKQHRRNKKTVPKSLKQLLQVYHDIYFDRNTYCSSFAERENKTLLAITANPKKVKQKRAMMYHRQDISDYAPGSEKRQQKNYLDEKEYKLNWYTPELVHKKGEQRGNPAPYI